jgi:hypothetical protein
MAIKFGDKPERPDANGEGKSKANGKARKTSVKGGKAKPTKTVAIKGAAKQKKI